MELKNYQHKVIKDLELYLEYVQRFKKTDTAFNKFWEDRIGPYNALSTIFSAWSSELPKLVIWLVPWSNLLDQTFNNLSNPDHPYRQKLDSLFNHRVEVYQKKDLLSGSNFNPSVVKEQLSIIVMSFSSLRARNKDDRKVYQENGQLATFVSQYKDKSHLLEDTDDTALINVIRSLIRFLLLMKVITQKVI